MASLSRLEALLLDVTSYTLNSCSFWNKAKSSVGWLGMHTKEKPSQSGLWLALKITASGVKVT